MATPKKQYDSLSVNEKLKLLDRINSGAQRQKIVAETGISSGTRERIVANEAKIRESATEIYTSRKRPDREFIQKIIHNCFFG